MTPEELREARELAQGAGDAGWEGRLGNAITRLCDEVERLQRLEQPVITLEQCAHSWERYSDARGQWRACLRCEWSSHEAQCIRLGIEEDLLYEYDSDDVCAVGATWFVDAFQTEIGLAHLDFVLRDERVAIPERKRNA